MEKEFEKECIDVQLNHSAAHLKLTQRYTSTIFQHKIKIKLKFQKERPLKKIFTPEFTVFPKWKKLKCLSKLQHIKKPWYTSFYPIKYHGVLKRNELYKLQKTQK